MSQPQFYKNLETANQEHWYIYPTYPKITKKQFDILDLLYNFRYLDRKQIQILMDHKNHKRIQAWLNDLTKKQYIERIYKKTMLDNTKPAVYFLSTYGRKLLKDNGEEYYSPVELKNTYRDKQRSQVFRLQKLLLADCYITLAKYYNNAVDYGMNFMTPGDLFYKESEELNTLRPDAFMRITNNKKNANFNVNLFIIHERKPKFFIRARMRHIIDYLLEVNGEQHQDQVFLIVATKTRIKNYAKIVLNAKLERHSFMDLEEGMTFGFITIDELKEHALENITWNDLPYFKKKEEENW